MFLKFAFTLHVSEPAQFTSRVVAQAEVMPVWVCELPFAPQICWHSIRDPPSLESSVKTGVSVECQNIQRHAKPTEQTVKHSERAWQQIFICFIPGVYMCDVSVWAGRWAALLQSFLFFCGLPVFFFGGLKIYGTVGGKKHILTFNWRVFLVYTHKPEMLEMHWNKVKELLDWRLWSCKKSFSLGLNTDQSSRN